MFFLIFSQFLGRFCRAHRGGGRLRDPNCVRLSVTLTKTWITLQLWCIPGAHFIKREINNKMAVICWQPITTQEFQWFYSTTTPPPGTILHRMKIKPNYCPLGPRSLGLFPTRTTPHQDHYQQVKQFSRTNIYMVGRSPGGKLSGYGFQ